MWMKRILRRVMLLGLLVLSSVVSQARPAQHATWKADNGNGTFTNPLFYEEFSDPDMRLSAPRYLTASRCV